MAIRLKHSSVYSTYFTTFTNYNWIHLFQIANGYEMVYEWFDYLKINNLAEITSFVIMPNHLHVILFFKDANFNLNNIVANGKRFMSYKIVQRLREQNNLATLKILSDAVSEREKKKGQLHKVFVTSFDAKPIFSEKFLLQKINYIHHNPVSGKWKLVKDFTQYEHSSASFYESGEVKKFKPLHYLE
jgi:putative transposase